MAVEASVGVIGYFMPIFAFMLVFIIIYALSAGNVIDSFSLFLFNGISVLSVTLWLVY